MAVASRDIPIVGAAMHYLGMGQTEQTVIEKLQMRDDFGRVSPERARAAVRIAVAQLATRELARTTGYERPVSESQPHPVARTEIVTIRIRIDYTDRGGIRRSMTVLVDTPPEASPHDAVEFALSIWDTLLTQDSAPPGQDARPTGSILDVYQYRIGSGLALNFGLG